MKLYILVVLVILSTNALAQGNDTVTVYDHHCEFLNPFEIDTTYFWYNSDTLFIRNIHKSFCSPDELKAAVKTENDTIKISVFIPSGVDCLADCSFGYTIKLHLTEFETLNIKIFEENFKVVKSGLKSNIENSKIATIRTWPNPVTDRLHINEDRIQKLIISDLNGKCILEKRSGERFIDLTGLISGNYIITVVAEKETWSEMICKE